MLFPFGLKRIIFRDIVQRVLRAILVESLLANSIADSVTL